MSETLINKSLLSKNNFRLLIDKVPNVEYFVKTVNIPGLSFSETIQPAGIGLDAFFPGDKVSFDALSVSFLVDEDLGNFKEIFDWMDSITPVSDPSAYKNFVKSESTPTGSSSKIGDTLIQYSDITLVTNTNKNIPNRFFRFHDAFPISLSGIELESGADGETVIATVEFRFTYYEIKTTS
tara:strand:- start:1222 stop:1764 length:543 start_codon:yes stop_codon:yes gene_type:complete